MVKAFVVQKVQRPTVLQYLAQIVYETKFRGGIERRVHHPICKLTKKAEPPSYGRNIRTTDLDEL